MNGALIVDQLAVRYGGVLALDDVSLCIAPGRVVGLIGPNGAGKTSLINAVTGVVRPYSGSVTLGRTRLERLAQHVVARPASPARIKTSGSSARSASRDNVRAGALRRPGNLDDAAIRTLVSRAGIVDADLGGRAGALPYGAQRRLEIARALAGKPAIVLLDEPAAGMNPRETGELRAVIRDIAAEGPASCWSSTTWLWSRRSATRSSC